MPDNYRLPGENTENLKYSSAKFCNVNAARAILVLNPALLCLAIPRQKSCRSPRRPPTGYLEFRKISRIISEHKKSTQNAKHA